MDPIRPEPGRAPGRSVCGSVVCGRQLGSLSGCVRLIGPREGGQVKSTREASGRDQHQFRDRVWIRFSRVSPPHRSIPPRIQDTAAGRGSLRGPERGCERRRGERRGVGGTAGGWSGVQDSDPVHGAGQNQQPRLRAPSAPSLFLLSQLDFQVPQVPQIPH